MAEEPDNSPRWLPIVTVTSSLLSTIGVAALGLFGTIWNQEIQRKINAENSDKTAQLERMKLEEQRRSRQKDIIIAYVPNLLSSNESEKKVAVGILFTIYPNEAKDILLRANQVLTSSNNDSANQNLKNQNSNLKFIKQAEVLNNAVGYWTVVAGSDSDLEAAKFEAKRAIEQGYSGVNIYERGTWFATTIGNFPNQGDAESANVAIRRNIRDSAFVVNLKSWCPQPKKRDGYQICQ